MKRNLKRQMQNTIFFRSQTFVTFLTLLLVAFCGLINANAQARRDHLTELEGDLVREAQELDRRTEILTKAIERRMEILNGKPLNQKEVEKYGEPKGTKAQLLYDISKILLSAIDNIEYVAEKDANNKLFSRSIHMLADASRKYLPQLEIYKKGLTDKMEQAAVLNSIDYCEQIIDASAKVPKDLPKEEKTKEDKKKKSSGNKDDSN